MSGQKGIFMRNKCFKLILVLYLFQVFGCQADRGTKSNDSIQPVTLQQIQQKNYDLTLTDDHIRVFCDKEYSPQARCILDSFPAAISHIENSTGFKPSIDINKIYVLKNENNILPEWQRFYTEDGVKKSETGLILFASASNESCESFLSQNYLYPYMYIHEIVEETLRMRKGSYQIPMDIPLLSFWPVKGKSTRWFREGFSSYAGFLAHKHIWSGLDPEQYHIPYAQIEVASCHPFSTLAKVKKDLFTWPQYHNGKFNSNVLYYEASLGLFLHMEHLYGQKVIKDIVSAIPSLKRANGSALIKLVNNKINTNIEMLAENFQFPETGMETDTVIPLQGAKIYEDGAKVINVEPNSFAEQAGIQADDFICKMNNIDIKTNLDYELTLYNLMNSNEVQIELVRDRKHIITKMQITLP